jgi:hypothetical protein
MPHAFTAHPDQPAVAYLIPLHAYLGGQIKANKLKAIGPSARAHSGTFGLLELAGTL